MVLHAGTQNLFGLGESARDLVQTRDVVLIVLHRVQRHGERQIGQVNVRALHLAERHLVFLERMVVDALLQRAHQHLVRHHILRGKTAGRYRHQARKEILVAGVAASDSLERVVVQLLVVAIVAVGRRALGISFQIRLVLLFEQRVLSCESRLDAGGLGRERRARGDDATRSEDQGGIYVAHGAQG
jgi:hypothetical protein